MPDDEPEDDVAVFGVVLLFEGIVGVVVWSEARIG